MLAAGAASATAHSVPARDATDPGTLRLSVVDVHSHIAPPPWIAQLAARGLLGPQAVSPELVQAWSPDLQLEAMDRAGVSKTINSVTMPGVWFGDAEAARRLARECNDYSARLRDDHRDRLGMFTVLPLPDIDSSLHEIAYGLDTLKADGVHLFTSYGDVWLGDPIFAPIFEELDQRSALVHVHPTVPNCCRNLVPGIGIAAIELGTDTSRAIARFVFSGSSQRYQKIRMIFSHAGGTMPFLIERFEYMAKQPANKVLVPGGFRAEAKRFYYDTAQASSTTAMSGLKALVPVSHILFGTDYPIRSQAETLQSLSACGVFTADELMDITSRNLLNMCCHNGTA
jgi:predicted TIM-barrel fold metal-dependent hydrolase